jgi:hypothetical protein
VSGEDYPVTHRHRPYLEWCKQMPEFSLCQFNTSLF